MVNLKVQFFVCVYDCCASAELSLFVHCGRTASDYCSTLQR